MAYRLERVQSRIQEEVSRLILEGFDFGGSLVTVTRVVISPDVQHATVYISVLPPAGENAALRHILHNVWSLQKLLDKRLSMRPVPRLRFELDAESKQFTGIDGALENLRRQSPSPRLSASSLRKSASYAKRPRIRKTPRRS